MFGNSIDGQKRFIFVNSSSIANKWDKHAQSSSWNNACAQLIQRSELIPHGKISVQFSLVSPLVTQETYSTPKRAILKQPFGTTTLIHAEKLYSQTKQSKLVYTPTQAIYSSYKQAKITQVKHANFLRLNNHFSQNRNNRNVRKNNAYAKIEFFRI